jgi:hypothetical protein
MAADLVCSGWAAAYTQRHRDTRPSPCGPDRRAQRCGHEPVARPVGEVPAAHMRVTHGVINASYICYTIICHTHVIHASYIRHTYGTHTPYCTSFRCLISETTMRPNPHGSGGGGAPVGEGAPPRGHRLGSDRIIVHFRQTAVKIIEAPNMFATLVWKRTSSSTAARPLRPSPRPAALRPPSARHRGHHQS